MSGIGTLNSGPPHPQIPRDKVCRPLAASLVGVEGEGLVNGEEDVRGRVRWVNKWEGIEGVVDE